MSRTGLLLAVGLVAIDATALAATKAPTVGTPGASLERRAWAALLTGNTEVPAHTAHLQSNFIAHSPTTSRSPTLRRRAHTHLRAHAVCAKVCFARSLLDFVPPACVTVQNMTTLALVQIASVRRFSKHPHHVTMVTPEVNEVARKQLRAAGSHIVEVGMITPPWQISASWWNTVFTKLQIFSLRNSSSAGVLDKVAFVDLDAFIVSEKADTIFDACGAREVSRVLHTLAHRAAVHNCN